MCLRSVTLGMFFQECDALSALLDATRQSIDQLRRGGDDTVVQLREEQRAMAKKAAADFDAERKGLQVQGLGAAGAGRVDVARIRVQGLWFGV